MDLRVGVVCEGSHDFNVLQHFIDRIIRESGETVGAIDCLQPEVSASFQVNTGGWVQVKSWCEEQNGEGYRRYMDKPLFASSPFYDILIVHLDGDVVTHCKSDPLAALHIDGMSVEDVITALQDAVKNNWLRLAPEHKSRVVACVPVRHLEAWLSAAIGPKVADHEGFDMKDTFRSGPASSLPGTWRNRYIAAAKQSMSKMNAIKLACASFRTFEADLQSAAQDA